MQGVRVGLGVHGDGLDAQVAAGADDPHRDLAAVGHQDAIRRPRHSTVTMVWPASTMSSFSTSKEPTVPASSATTLVELLHDLDEADDCARLDRVALLHELVLVRARAPVEDPRDGGADLGHVSPPS